jgi:putative flippase GtrA
MLKEYGFTCSYNQTIAAIAGAILGIITPFPLHRQIIPPSFTISIKQLTFFTFFVSKLWAFKSKRRTLKNQFDLKNFENHIL